MTRVKICGLTRFEDATWAAECGAHALGFILEPSSPRYVGGSSLLGRLGELAPYVVRVAVYGPLPEALAPEFDAVQGIGGRLGGARFVKSLRLKQGETLESALSQARDADGILLDAFDPSQYGGSGKTIDWGLAAEFVAACELPVILAGGLTPENVAEAIRKVMPYAVDVSSGVESSPGIKDPEKVRRFVSEALDYASQ